MKLIQKIKAEFAAFKTWEIIGVLLLASIILTLITACMSAFFYIAYWILK